MLRRRDLDGHDPRAHLSGETDHAEGFVASGVRRLPLDRLFERAARAASGLVATGARDGRAIAILLRNDIPFLEALFAASFAGAYGVPINWHSQGEEVEHVLADSEATHLVVHADLLPAVREHVPDGVVVLVVPTPLEILRAYGIEADHAVVPEGDVDWASWLEGFPPRPKGASPPRETMVYTSGTTGRPKGVRRRQAPSADARRASADARQEWFHNRPGMRTAILGPLYHSGQISTTAAAVRARAAIFLPPRFDPEGVLRLIAEERLTHLHLVPIMMSRLVQLPEAVRRRYDVSSLESVVHGAAPCPPGVKRALIEWWGPIVHEYYATTEAGMVTRASSEEWLERPGTVGRPLPGRVVRILDEDGNPLPPLAEGEVFMDLGELTDFTYHHGDDERAAIERDGLVTTGDVGYLDEDGYLYLCDRKRDMVISGGVNIYPAEIEAVLASHPAVADCAVFGVPDDEFGEALHAVVEPQAGAPVSPDELLGHVRAQLASFKVPRAVELVGELPRDDSGKIAKRLLRDPYWAGAGRRI